MNRWTLALAAMALLATACSRDRGPVIENYSCARLDQAVVKHIAMELTVDFESERIGGVAVLDIETYNGAKQLCLDTWALNIMSVRLDGKNGPETGWTLGDSLDLIGRPLLIDIEPETRRVAIEYATGEDARGVQWLAPAQTLSGRYPFLYTQSQAILARSWVPCQDTPEVRITYSARVKTPPELLALMSARNPKEKSANGVYNFEMKQPIPPYLLALAVGELEYRAVSERCGVYAEPDLVDEALWEFIDMERMTKAAEALYGPYLWEQFDVLVLPPSFPYGGMENPRLTFATPILVAGDRSLVATIAHELAHSWSGNLVTNATWEDSWLNEGFTTYFERRIMETLYGRGESEMHALLGRKEIEDEIAAAEEGSLDTALYIPLEGRDPDQYIGWSVYEKGYLFLRLLEETYGREKFDAFLREYFNAHAFQTMTTARFLEYLDAELIKGDAEMAARLRVDEWVYQAHIPDNAPRALSPRFDHAAQQAATFLAGTKASELETDRWSSSQWQHFLENLNRPLTTRQLDDLAQTFRFTNANGEVQRSWYLLVIDNDYQADFGAMEKFLTRYGRRWLLRPIYTKLAETEDGKKTARRIYRQARPRYHSATQTTIDNILDWKVGATEG